MKIKHEQALELMQALVQIGALLNQKVYHTNSITPNAIKIMRADAETIRGIISNAITKATGE